MTLLTKEGVERVLGPVDESLAADLCATGASEEELREAHAWVSGDEALVNEHRSFPQGRVAELVGTLHAMEGPLDEDESRSL